MTVRFVTDFAQAQDLLNQFVYGPDFSKLEEELQTRVKALATSPSPVDRLANITELLYARRDELPDSAKELVAAYAAFCAQNGFHGMAEGNRGGLISQAMQRELGQKAPAGTKFQKSAEDPEARPEFRPQAAAATPPPEVPAASEG